MVSRHWRGLAHEARAEDYIQHLQRDTFPALERLSGFRGASILRRSMPGGVEFLVVTEWESLDSIRAFAGDNIGSAVVPPLVQAMMVSYDDSARHYDVVAAQGR